MRNTQHTPASVILSQNRPSTSIARISLLLRSAKAFFARHEILFLLDNKNSTRGDFFESMIKIIFFFAFNCFFLLLLDKMKVDYVIICDVFFYLFIFSRKCSMITLLLLDFCLFGNYRMIFVFWRIRRDFVI